MGIALGLCRRCLPDPQRQATTMDFVAADLMGDVAMAVR